MHTFEWAIEDIMVAHPNLYVEHCVVMAVALMSRHAISPCEFILECIGFRLLALGVEAQCLLRVSWTQQTALKAQGIWHTEQPKSIVERAAVALAALILAKFLPEGQMQVTKIGDRADYWLPRLQCALEVSGTEQARALRRRHREKVRQVLSNPLQWSGYVIVCCFTAQERRILWSYHAGGHG
jgi:hypothetical protein